MIDFKYFLVVSIRSTGMPFRNPITFGEHIAVVKGNDATSSTCNQFTILYLSIM